MATDEQNLSAEQKELVAVGASVGSGCHPCVDHHLKAGAKAGLDGERLLAAVTSAEQVTAEAAVLMADHVRGKLGRTATAPATLSLLEDALASFGAALGANDANNIERQLRAAVGLGASRPQLQQAIETAQKVQENAMRIHVREAERLLDAVAPPAAAPANDTPGGCGCGAEDDTEAAPLEAQAPDPAAGFADSMAELFAAADTGDMAGLFVAMANCRRMFDGACSQSAAPAETNEPPAAIGATGSSKEVCR